MTIDQTTPDVETRIEGLARDADLTAVADVLATQQADIIAAWMRMARKQPFHAEQPERAVADHIPALVEAIARVIRRTAAPDREVEQLLDDDAVANAAKAHAATRFEQGLGPVAIATEFRLLRQEISSALRQHLDDDLPASDVLSAVMVVNDALDGATAIALSALTERVETLREEFLATTMHDIRQPITIVEGSLILAARWLRREPLDVERLIETVDSALSATVEMTLFVETLADASRLALGMMQLETEPTSMRQVLADAVAGLAGDARERVRVEGESASGVVGDWDPRAIRRVVANLLTNAVKYAPGSAPIVVTLETSPGEVHLSVRDEGIGLAPAELATLFGRYVRAETARSRGFPGLGLGLYACRGLVDAHGGRIWLESDGPGRGTVAHVVLPVGRAEA